MNSDTMIDPIEMLDAMLERGEDIWEVSISIGDDDENAMSIRRWRQGDVSMRIQKQYGENSISKYAAAINVNTSTLQQRRQMSDFYEKNTRYLFPSLGYSHYREALRLGNLERALWALGKADDKQWTVFRFKELLSRLLGKRRNANISEGIVTRSYSQSDGHYLVIRSDMEIKTGQRITIRPK